jgi:hypothetical protein
VFLSEYKVGGAMDVKGNFRVYDLVRFRKIAKVSSNIKMFQEAGRNLRSSISVTSTGSMMKEGFCFRMIPRVCFDISSEEIVLVQNSN